MNLRPADHLASAPNPAWPLVCAWMDASPSRTLNIDVDHATGLSVLHRLQVTASSVLGALALHTGGLVADHGWFRILGAGGSGLPDLATASGLPVDPTDGAGPASLLVAFDALGGQFAIDGGGLGISPGEVCYFGPDSLAWEGLGGGHAAFVEAALTGGLAETFRQVRWDGWEEEVAALSPAEGLAAYPPPFTSEGRDLGSAARRAVPLSELVSFYEDAAAQMGAQPSRD